MKNAVGEHSSLSLVSGIEKVWMRGWGGGAECQSFPSKISCLTVPKKFVGEPFKVSLFSGIEKVHASDNYVIFSSKFFVSKNQKTLQGNPSVLCSRNIPVAKMFKVKRGSIKILRRKIFV